MSVDTVTEISYHGLIFDMFEFLFKSVFQQTLTQMELLTDFTNEVFRCVTTFSINDYKCDLFLIRHMSFSTLQLKFFSSPYHIILYQVITFAWLYHIADIFLAVTNRVHRNREVDTNDFCTKHSITFYSPCPPVAAHVIIHTRISYLVQRPIMISPRIPCVRRWPQKQNLQRTYVKTWLLAFHSMF